MVICSGAACVGPTVAFYYMAEMSALLYDPDTDSMRADATWLASLLAILALVDTLLFLASGYFNGTAGAWRLYASSPSLQVGVLSGTVIVVPGAAVRGGRSGCGGGECYLSYM